MVDWNKPIKFRNINYPVRFVSFLKQVGQNDRALVIYEDLALKREIVLTLDSTGEKSPGQSSQWDIVNIPTKRVHYMNIYKGPAGVFPGKLFENEDDCRRAAQANKSEVIKTIAVELEV